MSPRKRTSSKTPTEPPTTPASGLTAASAGESATPVGDPPAGAGTEPTAGAAAPQGSDAPSAGEGFAEKVGQKKWVAPPDPFGIAGDNLAGVQLFESKQDRQMAIKFGEGRPEDKPSQAVIDKLKEAGYRWNPSHKIWAHPVRGDSAMSTRIEAEWLYQEVRQMIRQEKGIEPGLEIPF